MKKKLFLILLALLPVVLFTGCSNRPSPRQVAKYNQIDSEASTNLGAIFTDETALNATNSLYISAGYISDNKGAINLTSKILPHSFYSNTVHPLYNNSLPFKCAGLTKTSVGMLLNGNGKKVKSGFTQMGFLPQGSLDFYYFVKVLPNPSTMLPKKLTKPPIIPSQSYVSCGNGYEAFAVTNLTGNNIQVYELNDYSSWPVLVYGKSYRKNLYRQGQSVQDNE
ncbi:MAG: hypothetical protein M0Z72_04635 [Deltaproteobacteria bacterium]|nr:hypothetical protein [Deltaproteobacteria bacterium]